MKHDKFRMCYKGHLIVSFNNFEFIVTTPKGLRAALQASSLLALQKHEAFWRYNNTALFNKRTLRMYCKSMRSAVEQDHRIVLFNKPALPSVSRLPPERT